MAKTVKSGGVAVAAVVSLLLAACTATTGGPEGATTGVGDNSAFTQAGIEHIEDEGRAVIDLRGPLTASDLGAADGEILRDVDVRGDDPIEVTVTGTDGDLVVPAEVIRVLVGPDAEVQSIALFERQDGADALAARLEEVGAAVGANSSTLDSYVARLGDERSQIWLNDGDDLGFTAGLHPVHDPAGETVLEYQLTPPG